MTVWSCLYPGPGQGEDGGREPGEAHHPPGLGHGAHRPGLEGIHDGVESLQGHAGKVQHGAYHGKILREEYGIIIFIGIEIH